MYREQEVRAGIAYLDRVKPDWRAQINPATLDVGNECQCILSQTFDADYDIAVGYYLGLSDEKAESLGFYIMPDDLFSTWSERKRQFADLTETWKHLFDEKPVVDQPLERTLA